jgi:hypothetical protein
MIAACAGAVMTSLLVAGTATSAQAATYLTPKGLLAKLSTASETGFASYDRSKFQYPIDANGDCQDTRAEVLQQESRTRVQFTSASRCFVRYGTWYSWYDGATAKSASNIQIDHLVPLYEAWTSGARKWNAATRKNFANDLAYPATLTAVSASSNLSKGSKDPAQWLPPLTSSRCKYVIQWMQVKYRWHLTIDSAERSKILSIISTGNCNATAVKLPARATIGYATTTGGTGGGGNTGGGTTDPRYGTCTEAKSHGLGPYYRGIDREYYWYDDRDNDGIVCE